MAEQNTSNTDTVAASKAALVTDLNSSLIGKESYSHARNAVRNSKDGDLGTIGNEPSNTFCFSAPYKIIGTVDLPDGTTLICSGNGFDSEIGVGSIKDCTYKTVKNLKCFNFNPDFPITGVAKHDFQKGILVTITDKNNPVRRFELKKLANIKSCNDILLFRKLAHPCLTLKEGQIGNIPNGMYSVAIAYVVDNQVFTDWFSITNRISLFSLTGANSLEVRVSGLNPEFEKYSLVLIGNYVDPVTKGATKIAKIIGTYSTKTTVVEITDFLNSTYKNIELSQLINKNKPWLKAGIISSNSNYLILGDLVGREEENYQLKAMSIRAEYVVKQVPAEYYENGGEDIGYYRDENYDFYIQGIYNTGEETDKFHIPGRIASFTDKAIVSSADVYEYDTQFKDCVPPDRIQRWHVENTAGKLIPYNNQFKCDERILGHGEMGYFESTELYSDNKAQFGNDINTPIRYHKMPDECKIARYSNIDGKKYINILGVRFKNIPKFDSPDVVGYKITRSDRKGGNGTVVARGLITNLRSYNDKQIKQEILYSNYPVNDLRPDSFLSSTQTSYKKGAEHDFSPLTEYSKDKFSFYSPHTLFEPRYSLGTELKIESEEIATVTGKFELVYNHPKQKLMNQFAFWVAAAAGFIESSLILLGKSTVTGKSILSFKGVTAGAEYELDTTFKIESVEDLISLDIAGYIAAAIKAGAFDKAISAIKTILISIAALGLKIPYSILSGIREADAVMSIIYNLTGYTDYVYQYNAHAEFNNSLCVADGNKRRRLTKPATYIPSDVVSVSGKTFNNYFRESTVYLELNKEIANPVTQDTSRQTATEFGVCKDLSKETSSIGSAFYATSKTLNPNQYGALGSSAPVAIHSCTLTGEATDILFGGDCIITKFQFQKRMEFFNQNLVGTNYPNGTEYDYRLYRNIAYPRFWMDSTKYDFSLLISKNIVNFTRFTGTTTSKYNLDCKHKRDGGAIARIDDAYMYLSNNCVLDFFVEADYNVSFREKTEHPFYSKENTNLPQIFRADRLKFPEEFKINRAFSDLYTTEIYAQQQRQDYDPNNPIPVLQPNSVIYSLPSFNLQNVDNWQYFLPANYFAFRESDFGELTAIHKLDQDRIAFLFSKSSPYISMGRDFLQLEGSGRKVTIGDGGLFAQDPREVMPTDNNYGACNSRYAFANTHLGRYYPSESQGRILQFSESLDDITRQGISYWCKNYMPITLYNYFPSFPEIENPINGVGYLMAFDSFNETIYITKRDFAPKPKLDINWDTVSKSFMYKGTPISMRDSNYFNDISWTLSYSPLDKGFVSYHDWHPDWIVQTDNHFVSIKDNSIWKHNESYDSFCNFYGKDFPFEIEFVSTSGQQIEIIRSLEYLLEVYKYKNFGRDKFHVLNENFDKLIVRNTEQISPLINLIHGNPNAEENLKFPKKSNTNPLSYDVAFFKEENKYRVNQFWDSTKDRGEFTGKEIHLFPTDESGYKSVINPMGIDIDKPEDERKKFRHYWNKLRLIKTISGPNKFITKVLNIKKLISIK